MPKPCDILGLDALKRRTGAKSTVEPSNVLDRRHQVCLVEFVDNLKAAGGTEIRIHLEVDHYDSLAGLPSYCPPKASSNDTMKVDLFKVPGGDGEAESFDSGTIHVRSGSACVINYVVAFSFTGVPGWENSDTKTMLTDIASRITEAE